MSGKKNIYTRITKTSSSATPLLLLAFSIGLSLTANASDEFYDDSQVIPVDPTDSAFDGAEVDGGFYVFGRNRRRWDHVTRHYKDNLKHITSQAAINYRSPDFLDRFSFETGMFGAYDNYSGIDGDDPAGPVQQENEFSFAGDKWGRPYSDGEASDKVSLLKARGFLKLQDNLTVSAGLGQFRTPGLIGTNWSYMPGSYRGMSVDWDIEESFKLSYILVDRYKAPWFRKVEKFSAHNAWDADRFDGDNEISYLQGIAAEFAFSDYDFTLSAGESEGYMRGYFAKAAHTFALADGLDMSYQFYGSDTQSKWDDGAHGYKGLATYQAITSSLTQGKYNYKLEATWVKADGDIGNFLPRLTRGYGNSQGGLEIWWDLRSDWNADNEKAVFFSVSRDMADLFNAPGWTLTGGGAYGWDIEYKDLPDNAKESAWKVDLSYTGQFFGVKDATFAIHYMDYRNHQNELGDWNYPNLFQSERDIMLKIMLPFGQKL